MIEAVEGPGPSGQPRQVFRGPLPLVWKHQQVYPSARTVGARAVADFLAISEQPSLSILTMITPNSWPVDYFKPTKMWITLVAKSSECDSEPIKVEIAWNGQWEPGETEIKKHLSIAAV
jgi:hypothetical protein